MKFNNLRFETSRLLLRPTGDQDAGFILELLNSPGWIKYIGDRNIHSIEQAKAYIEERMTPQLYRLGYGNFTLISKDSKQPLGTCGLYDRDGLDGVDIGFALLPQYHCKGYAYEASQKILNLAWEQFGLSIVRAITTDNNYASQSLIEKLGMKFIEKITLPNDPEQLRLYEIAKPSTVQQIE